MSVLPPHSLNLTPFSTPAANTCSGHHHIGHWISLLTALRASSLVCLLSPKNLSTKNGLENYPSLRPFDDSPLTSNESSLTGIIQNPSNLSALSTPFFSTKCPHFVFHAPASLKFSSRTMISVLQVIAITCLASLTSFPSVLDLFCEAFPGLSVLGMMSHLSAPTAAWFSLPIIRVPIPWYWKCLLLLCLLWYFPISLYLRKFL